jgi:hypothetical protein
MARLAHVPAPAIELPEERPLLPIEEYLARLEATRRAMAARGLDLLIVYADREHSATLAFLTGVDPRFEEALLLLPASGNPRLLLGNEGLGYGPDRRLELEVELFQELSLPGQPRGASRPLREILAAAGAGPGVRIGCAGWKRLSALAGDATAIEIPAYVVDLLRDLAGERRLVTNENGIFSDLQGGLRLRNSAAQIAAFEYAALTTSAGVLAATRALVPGVRERELERHLDNRGLTLICHTMVNFGAKVGIASPSDARAVVGDAWQIAYGLAGGLTCRAGSIAAGPEDLPAGRREAFAGLVENYFDVVATWYESVRIGTTGGAVFAAVEAVRDPERYTFMLNPGHHLALDEWVESPFVAGDATPLGSGIVLQSDIIPVPAVAGITVNIEDGVALADAALRAELARDFPETWARIEARRTFLRERLGVTVDESLLPLSGTPLWHAPYALAPELALTR